MKNINLSELSEKIESLNLRSAWSKGVKEYAEELIAKLEEYADYNGTPGTISALNSTDFEHICLNGADNWNAYSYGGCSLIYNTDIAERLCAPWELKRTKNGQNDPNARELWIDVQARALRQAFDLLCRCAF